MRKYCIVMLLLIPFLCINPTIGKADIIIIANTSVSENELSKDDIRQIFLGKIVKWQNNTNIHFVLLSGDIHKAFLKTYIRRSSIQYRNYWRKMLFTGKGIIPKSFNTEKDLIQYVTETQGAIGYIKDDTKAENVNIILVN